jgi:phosphoglycolate phosphatase
VESPHVPRHIQGLFLSIKNYEEVSFFMADSSPIRLVVFDCDGTLVDSQRNIIRAMTAAFRDCGLPDPTAEEVRSIVGLSLREAMAALTPDLDDEAHAGLVDAYRNAYTVLRMEEQMEEALYPGVHEVLKDLETAGYLLGVATGKSLRGLHATIERHGLGGRFVTLQTADLAPSKPHPAMLHQAMDEAGAAPEQTVLVGDTTFDMDMAANAGVAAIGVSWGYHPVARLRGAGAAEVIDEFAVLPALVRTLTS